MPWCCVNHVLIVDGAAQGSNHRFVPRNPLQEPQWVLLERNIKEDFYVVQKNHVACGYSHNLCEKARRLQSPLALVAVKHAPREFEIDVDKRSRDPLMDFLERSSLACARRSHQQD